MNIVFKKYGCRLTFHKYNNGRPAIILEDLTDLSTVAVASVNIPDELLEEDEIAIKDYSENEGMLECLVNAGVVSQPTRHCMTDFVLVPICKLLIKPEYE
jgi:hypothetical protein